MIEILLATYNGERFLGQQLDSLFAQTYQDWTILVRDDGSTDKTLDIIRFYQQKHPQKIILVQDSNKNLGPRGNFSILLERSSAPYVMFCDQDDVWLEDKIERSINALKDLEKTHGDNTPILLYSDLEVVDDNLRIISASMMKQQKLNPRKNDLAHICMTNVVSGCTSIMNRALAQKAVPIPQEARMHDSWVALVAAATGFLQYLPEATIKYRQHEANVVGANNFDVDLSSAKNVKARISANIEQAAALLNRSGGELSLENRRILEDFVTIRQQGFIKRRHILIRHGLLKHNLVENIGLLFLI